ncbi:MAG TPA: 2-succinyl-6-hydroxy-2,4-cyclohexadiene-1-carboxylate synthase [Chloroflexota bacterium]
MKLHIEDFGGAGQPLILLHGFTGSCQSWREIAARLEGRWRPIGIDLPGHGRAEAPAEPDAYRIEPTVAALLAALERLGLADRPHLLGYSMGGRAALHLALAAQERFATLTLESASPGILDPAERAARVRGDEALAELLERGGIEPFVDRWERLPLFASQASLPAATRTRVRAGRLGQRALGLANSLRGFGGGVPAPLQPRLGELRLPTLLLVGALDAKYCRIGREMVAALPDADLVVVPAAGHAVHLERPDAFVVALSSFLQERESAIRLA